MKGTMREITRLWMGQEEPAFRIEIEMLLKDKMPDYALNLRTVTDMLSQVRNVKSSVVAPYVGCPVGRSISFIEIRLTEWADATWVGRELSQVLVAALKLFSGAVMSDIDQKLEQLVFDLDLDLQPAVRR